MSLADRVKGRLRRFLERPGTTVDLAPLRAAVPKVQARAADLAELSDSEFTAAAQELREQPDQIEACALAREAAVRGLGQTPFDVQVMGALTMLSGNVAEMATGEGKTLAAAIAASGFALGGRSVHVLTANDYLARRDGEWMGPVYRLLGLTVGSVGEGSTPEERRAAYACDITYLTVSEAGFDHLRDGTRVEADAAVQRELDAVIIDEADAILIDEARVPLVLAGQSETTGSPVRRAARVVGGLRPGRDYEVGEDGRSAHLTDAGAAEVERQLGGVHLYEPEQLDELTAIHLALHARALLRRDADYIVRDGKVALVDEHRGRVAHRRRWPDGLQAAVEAKEDLAGSAEGEVLATISVQAFVRLYRTIAGMTGTAIRVGDQLREFYGLEVAVIPPNRPCIRDDEPDLIYATVDDKEAALLAEVAAQHATGRPVLIGTLDVAESERLAGELHAAGIECAVLNARNDASEAEIIAEAGGYGVVTVSTQMAGRGTDIRLGGSDEADRDRVTAVGGLYVIGYGRHDSRRVDDQLRGRAGRQGDPGGSVFFVSVDDTLVARFAQDAVPKALPSDADGLVQGTQIRGVIDHAQRVAEAANLEIHRNTWRYHVVLEQQRRVLAECRDALLTRDAAARLIEERIPDRYDDVFDDVGEEALERVARAIALHHLDRRWAEHLADLAELREGVHLRTLARLDPLDEFHRAAIPAFNAALTEYEDSTVETFDEAEITKDWEPADAGLRRPSATWTYMVHDDPFDSDVVRLAKAVRPMLTWMRGGPAPK